MASTMSEPAVGRQSTQFIITLDRSEKRRWKSAAEAAGVSMAEYVRRAVQAAEAGPSPEEIAAARQLASQINVSVDRMEHMLDRAIRRVDDALDPVREEARRREILADLERNGPWLDLDALARSSAR